MTSAANACSWTLVGDADLLEFATNCGRAFTWDGCGPEADGAQFCLFCGRTLVEVRPPIGEFDVS